MYNWLVPTELVQTDCFWSDETNPNNFQTEGLDKKHSGRLLQICPNILVLDDLKQEYLGYLKVFWTCKATKKKSFSESFKA